MIAMEIPVFNPTMSAFEAGLNHLQNPSFISQLLNLAGIEEISLNYSFWTWGALIVAFLATFGGVINRMRFIVLRFWKNRSVSSENLLRPLVEDDDEDESCSSYSSDDEDEGTSEFENRRPLDEDFRVAGSSNCRLKLRRRRNSCNNRFSWSDFASGKSVVKLWDGLGLGLNFEDSSGSPVSIWDLNKDQIISSFTGGGCQIPAVSRISPAVIVSAGLEKNENAALRVWDARVRSQNPAVFAEWQPRRTGILGVKSGGAEKVYVRDDASSLTVRDMRSIGLTLEGSTESDDETWWDADAVIVPDGERGICFDGLPVNVGGSVASRYLDAVKSDVF